MGSREYTEAKRKPLTKNLHKNLQFYKYYTEHKKKGVNLEQASRAFNFQKQQGSQVYKQMEELLADVKLRPHKYEKVMWRFPDWVKENNE